MYENAFNAIEKALRAEEGISNELDYVEQTSWVLFLKYLHDLEGERRDRAELEGKDYAPIIDGRYRWDRWAAPKVGGQFDHNAALTGDDLGVIKRWDNGQPVPLSEGGSQFFTDRRLRVIGHDLAAFDAALGQVRTRRRDLDSRGIARHDDDSTQSQHRRGERDALGVGARRIGQHTLGADRQLRKGVECATELERADTL